MDEQFKRYTVEHHLEMLDLAIIIFKDAKEKKVLALKDGKWAIPAIYDKLVTPLKYLEDRYNQKKKIELLDAGSGTQKFSATPANAAERISEPVFILGQQVQEPRKPSIIPYHLTAEDLDLLFLDHAKGIIQFKKRVDREKFRQIASKLRETHDYVRGTKKGESGYFKIKEQQQ